MPVAALSCRVTWGSGLEMLVLNDAECVPFRIVLLVHDTQVMVSVNILTDHQ